MAQRSALVLATSEYQDSGLRQLSAATSDASGVSDVLADPTIGNFDVQPIVNPSAAVARRALDRFFADRGRDDVLLLYITGHGVKDEGGQLYFAVADTELGLLPSTSIPGQFVSDLMSRCRSRAIVLILDCCYSGAFTRGMTPRSTDTVGIGDHLSGRGRVIITSSSAIEYAFEGTELTDDHSAPLSVFSSTFVTGLRTGDADLDQDGWVTEDDLFNYVRDQVRTVTPHQSPSKWAETTGPIVIARNPRPVLPLPPELAAVITDPIAHTRLGAVQELLRLLNGPPTQATAARHALLNLTNDDSAQVAAAATAALAEAPPRSPQDPETASPQTVLPDALDEPDGAYTPEATASNDYWTTGDDLDYGPYAIAISEFIQHEDTTPPLTIGVKGPWGAGKTSLMRMVQDRLDPPVDSGASVGGGSRRWIRLSPPSRRKLAGARRSRHRAAQDEARATNRNVLRMLRNAASTPPEQAVERLRIDDAELNADWRPTVWFNPWMHQNGEQIWAGLAHEIISQVTARMRPADREAFWLELNLRRVDADLLRRRIHRALLDRLVPLAIGLVIACLAAAVAFLARSFVPGASDWLKQAGKALLGGGAAVTALAGMARTATFWRERVAGSLTKLVHQPDYAQTWKQLTAGLVRDPGYQDRLGLLYLTQTDMRQVLDLVASKDRPVVVFVDDLDRCSPSAVAQVIEAINLFLAGQFPNCIFVVAMEPEMVAAHIEVSYGSLVETLTGEDYWGEAAKLGWRFLDKIIQLPVSLPSLRSDQASQFLGTALVGGPARTSRVEANPEVDDGTAHWIEEAIRQRQSSLQDISEAAASAQQQAGGDDPAATGFSPETQQAMRRELRRRLRPDNPEVQSVVATVAGKLTGNPREIKRFVNVFRFYAVIRQERVAAGLPAPDTLTAIAKLAVLAVRWPHLRAALGRQIGPTERDTVLALLEAPIAELPEEAGWSARREALQTVLTNAQIPDKLRDCLLASEDLCQLLAAPPSIGTAAAGYL
ncbi:P-loop NTPase fold protein [Streptomyces sp. NPDC047043]|uniref:caspase, EACC1-associated type n=1 Tax=Streptomyces sp. NPDC047043 TaxID=3154497 RepID=UPI0033EAA51E